MDCKHRHSLYSVYLLGTLSRLELPSLLSHNTSISSPIKDHNEFLGRKNIRPTFAFKENCWGFILVWNCICPGRIRSQNIGMVKWYLGNVQIDGALFINGLPLWVKHSCFGPYGGSYQEHVTSISQMSRIYAEGKERIEIGNSANIAGHGDQNPMKWDKCK